MALTKYNWISFDVTPVASRALGFNSDADGLTSIVGTNLVLIKTLTASSSATLDFVDGSSDVVLDNTYPIYKFDFINIHPATDGAKFQFNLSVDTGSNYNVTKTTTFFHALHDEADGSALVAQAAARDLAQSTSDQVLLWEADNDADSNVTGSMYLFDPSSTTFVKHFLSVTSGVTNSTTEGNQYVAGYGNDTSAVDAVRFQFNSGNIDAGSIKLYGLKDS